MIVLRKYNTLTVTGTTAIRIPIIKRGVVDFAVSADWTPAAGDVKIWVDGTAANVTNLPTAINSGNCTEWEFVLTAAELSCKSAHVVVTDSATKAVEDTAFTVETFGHASAMYQADLSAANLPANVTQWLGTAVSSPTVAGVPNVNAKTWNDLATVALPLVPTTAGRTLDVSATGEAGIDWANVGSPTASVGLSGTTIKTATDVEADTADIQARIPAALTAGGNIKADALALSGDTVAADNAEAFFDGTGYAGTNNVIPTVSTLTGHTAQTGDSYPKVNELHAATVAATGTVGATRTTSSFFTNLTQSNNYWNDAILVFTSGNMDGISVIVEDFANTNGEVITSETMPLTPDAGITFTIVSRHTHSTAAIATATDTAVTDGITGTAVLAIQQILTGITSMADWIRRIVRKDAGTSGMVTAQSEINTGGTATFDGTTDATESVRDRGDVAWATATGFSTHSAADVIALLASGTQVFGHSYLESIKRVEMSSGAALLSGAGTGTEVMTSSDASKTGTFTVDGSGNVSAVVWT